MRRQMRRIRLTDGGGVHLVMIISDWLVTLLTSGSYMHSAETGGTMNLPGRHRPREIAERRMSRKPAW